MGRQFRSSEFLGEICQRLGIDIKTSISQHRSLLPNKKFKADSLALDSSKKRTFISVRLLHFVVSCYVR